ncbi:malonate decarboxylase holo-ACP synthase [Acinetobacter venetianus]|uniref:malonate decarboxylase holo-ACP synthase n=1 Tax=Acinetobacter venetianus TaxID=52133 RepID=UPI0007782D72|nr:malonate decarboxylase holo-ACP synthase [Acinetobacter venetianus]
MVMTTFQPHDLLWGMTPELLPDDVPQWAVEAVSEQRPVVVRRAVTNPRNIAVGIRGKQRSHRLALEMPVNTISKCVKPESLIDTDLSQFPHLQGKLAAVYNLMQGFNFSWGYTGSVGFELATGLKTVNENSDIDLLIRAQEPVSKLDAQNILGQLDDLNMKLDVQLQTPQGGVALREWAGTTGNVLLKRNDKAVLIDNPWS